jgi:hypothetical protein
VPPELLPSDKSPYAQGVREGATAALDEIEEWRKKWLDPIWTLLGSYHSTKLGKNVEKQFGKRPENHDAHHLVPWDHWRAQPARDVLEKWDINIDSHENGMWLFRPYHQTLSNNYRYIDTVNRMLGEANSKKEVLRTLEHIRNLLSTRRFPL